MLSIIVSFYFFLPEGIKEKTKLVDNVIEVNKVVYNAVPRDLISERVISTFVGQLTGYGPDCKGCSGITKSGYDVTNGNIYFNDDLYGQIRIVAADARIYKIGTIVRITAPNVFANKIIAIVLDTGGAIKGNKLDLLFSSEADTKGIGRQKNVQYEILRNGW